MIFKDVIQYLLNNKFIVILGGRPVLTTEFEVKYEQEGKEVRTTETAPIKQLLKTGDVKDIWNRFIKDAEIPHRVNAPGGGVYTVRHYTQVAAKKLKSIIETVDYDRLVESTKDYYKTVSYRHTLQNYLIGEIWEGTYQEWKGVATQIADGSSKWES